MTNPNYDKIEKEFEQLCEEHLPEINQKVEMAGKLLQQAIELSEKYGVPFPTNGTEFMSVAYLPITFIKWIKNDLKIRYGSDENIDQHTPMEELFDSFSKCVDIDPIILNSAWSGWKSSSDAC